MKQYRARLKKGCFYPRFGLIIGLDFSWKFSYIYFNNSAVKA